MVTFLTYWKRLSRFVRDGRAAPTHIDAHVTIDVNLTTLANDIRRQAMECVVLQQYSILQYQCTRPLREHNKYPARTSNIDRCFGPCTLHCGSYGVLYASIPTTLPPCLQGGEARLQHDARAIYAVCTQASCIGARPPKHSTHSRYVRRCEPISTAHACGQHSSGQHCAHDGGRRLWLMVRRDRHTSRQNQ